MDVASHFLDSGAFSQIAEGLKYYEEHKGDRWGFFKTKKFLRYLDDYARFIKKYRIAIDLYANLDVIINPELSFKNQKYLEKKYNLNPVPIIHAGTDLKWLKMYIDKGHSIIGLGGRVLSTSIRDYRGWLDRCFDIICNTPDRLPKVKMHGFGITSYELLLRYPWWSVDSATWIKIGAYGAILVPYKRGGRFVFNKDNIPFVLNVSNENSNKSDIGRHYSTLKTKEREIVEEWLDLIKIPLGKTDKKGNIIKKGVLNFHSSRKKAIVLCLEEMRKNLPEYPSPFVVKRESLL